MAESEDQLPVVSKSSDLVDLSNRDQVQSSMDCHAESNGKRPHSDKTLTASKIQHLEPMLSIKLPDVMHSTQSKFNSSSISDSIDSVSKLKESSKIKDDPLYELDHLENKDDDEDDEDCSSIDDDPAELLKSIVSDNLDDESIDDDGKILDKDNLEFKTELCLLQTETSTIDPKTLTKAEQEQLKQQLQERERERMQ